MNTAITIAQTILDTVTCYRCGVLFAFPENLMRKLRDTGDTFWCPNGHGQIFTKTTQQKLDEALAKAKRDREFAETRIGAYRDQAEAAERSNRALKGAATKLRKRIAAGVCPCCSRTFQDLSRHITNKHPNYTQEEVQTT